MLFGTFCAADTFYAPVCMRIRSYALPVNAVVSGYIDRVVALPGVQAWIADALAEADFIAEDEPYRRARD
jgi:glutathione S-transferase